MAGAGKTFKKIHKKETLQDRVGIDINVAKDPLSRRSQRKMRGSFNNPGTVLSATGEDLGESFTPEIPEPEEKPIIPIPDERTAETSARKRLARKKATGRQSTILTEGLGG